MFDGAVLKVVVVLDVVEMGLEVLGGVGCGWYWWRCWMVWWWW